MSMNSPAWLDEEEDAHNRGASTSASGTITTPLPVSPRTTQRGRAALEEAGLGFLCESEKTCLPELPALSQTPPTPSIESKKSNNSSIVEPFVAKSNTSAPVHFLKRMQKAETDRQEKIAARNAADGIEMKPVPPPPRSKPPANRSHRSGMSPKHPKPPAAVAQPSPQAIGVQQETSAQVDLGVVAELSDDDKRSHSGLIKIMGELNVRKLLSSRFQHRVECHREILESLVEQSNKAVDMALVGALRLGVADPVLQIATIAAEATKIFIVKSSEVATADGSRVSDHSQLKSVHKELMCLASDCVKKLKEAKCTQHCTSVLVELARVYGAAEMIELVCGSVVIGSALSPSSASPPAVALGGSPSTTQSPTSSNIVASAAMDASAAGSRGVMSRLEFSIAFVQSHKQLLSNDDWEIFMRFAAFHLNASNNKVRKTAMSLVVYLHPIGGAKVFQFLKNVNPATMKIVTEELGESAMQQTSQDMLTPSVSVLDQVELKQETEDIAACAADGALSSENSLLVDLWQESLVGLKSAMCLFCPRWKVRERFLERIVSAVANSSQLFIGSGGGKLPGSLQWNLKNATVIECLGQILEKALGDSVPAVAGAALRALRLALPQLPTGNTAWPLIDSVYPSLIKLACTTQSKEAVMDIVALMVTQLSGGSSAGSPQKLFEVISGIANTPKMDVTKAPPKLLIARMELLQHILVLSPQLDVPGTLTTGRCMEVATAYLEAPNPKVRLTTSTFVMELHSKVGSLIHPYLSKLSGTPAMEELRARLSNAASNKKNAKAVRLFNMVQPLAEKGASSTKNQAELSVRERVQQHQRAAIATPQTPVSPRNELKSPGTPRNVVTPAGSVLSASTPAPVSTPGRKSRLVFA